MALGRRGAGKGPGGEEEEGWRMGQRCHRCPGSYVHPSTAPGFTSQLLNASNCCFSRRRAPTERPLPPSPRERQEEGPEQSRAGQTKGGSARSPSRLRAAASAQRPEPLASRGSGTPGATAQLPCASTLFSHGWQKLLLPGFTQVAHLLPSSSNFGKSVCTANGNLSFPAPPFPLNYSSHWSCSSQAPGEIILLLPLKPNAPEAPFPPLSLKFQQAPSSFLPSSETIQRRG